LGAFVKDHSEVKTLDFIDNLSISITYGDHIFLGLDHSQLPVKETLLILINKYFFNTFFYELYSEPFMVSDISYKAALEQEFRYADYDPLGRSEKFEVYFHSCLMVHEYYDFFYSSIFDLFRDIEEVSTDANFVKDINKKHVLEMFQEGKPISSFTNFPVSQSLSFKEFLFIFDIKDFEGFFILYNSFYSNLLKDYNAFYNQINFLYNYFEVCFLPIEKGFLQSQDIQTLLLFSKKFYDSLMYFYVSDGFFFYLLELLQNTESQQLLEDFFTFTGRTIYVLEELISLLTESTNFSGVIFDSKFLGDLEAKVHFFRLYYGTFAFDLNLLFSSLDLLFYEYFFQYEEIFISDFASLFFYKKDLYAHSYDPLSIKR